MRIVTVCGMGVGTSVLLKMNTDLALERLGIEGESEAADLVVAKGVALDADLVLTNAQTALQFADLAVPVRVINDFMDVDEIAAVISELVGADTGSRPIPQDRDTEAGPPPA